MSAVIRPLAAIVFCATVALVAAGCGSAASSTPPPVSAEFMNGVATVSMTGAHTTTYRAQMINGRLVGDQAALSVQYGTVQTGALNYLGPATPGTYKTVRTDTDVVTLSLTVVLTSGDKPSDSFASTNGECAITIVGISATKGEATFTCTDLSNVDGDAEIDATGEFSFQP